MMKLLLIFMMFIKLGSSFVNSLNKLGVMKNNFPFLRYAIKIRSSRAIHMSIHSDTIFALSSGPIVKSGVAVIRISGSLSKKCLEDFCPTQKFPEQRRASLRRLICPKSGDTLDSALVLWFPGPKSFTGEDVVEFHVHGSRAVILGMFEAFEHLDSKRKSTSTRIRPAERGEFTRRAFENGRMDLTEVEGLADLLEADTSEQRKQALRQMDGHLKLQFEKWRKELLTCLAHTEAVIDFGDDDREDGVSDMSLRSLIPRVAKLRLELLSLLSTGRRGELVRDGLRIALVGSPNAGKSSLLNALARRPAAIVSPIAGTTRDIVDIRLDLGGVPCIVSDTAGLRGNSMSSPFVSIKSSGLEVEDNIDPVEQEGMRRAREAFKAAHLRLFVVDATSDLSSLQSTTQSLNNLLTFAASEDQFVNESVLQKDIFLSGESIEKTSSTPAIAKEAIHENSNVIIVLNKNDLKTSEEPLLLNTSFSFPCITVSCVTGDGIPELEKAMVNSIRNILSDDHGSKSSSSPTSGGVVRGRGVRDEDGVIITRERHRRHVLNCIRHLEVFLASQEEEVDEGGSSRGVPPISDKNALASSGDIDGNDDDNDGYGYAGLYMDVAAEELRLAMQDLGRVTGFVDVEELLDVIFRDFCIGK